MLVRDRLYCINQLCAIWFGPKPVFNSAGKPAKFHTQYHTIHRWFLDSNGNPVPGVVLSGSGKKHKFMQVPGWLGMREYERRSKGRAA
jgi:hypothetical protein